MHQVKNKTIYRVHGGIRHLEIKAIHLPSQSFVHGGTRHLEIC
ncbi:hypothetical protein HMPREF0020_02595 [Acinetobacter baumannii 6013113]|nr:hypothetical protein HMPREF0020_02595 [Acinetobacter baumannii 6013113]